MPSYEPILYEMVNNLEMEILTHSGDRLQTPHLQHSIMNGRDFRREQIWGLTDFERCYFLAFSDDSLGVFRFRCLVIIGGIPRIRNSSGEETNPICLLSTKTISGVFCRGDRVSKIIQSGCYVHVHVVDDDI